MKKLWLPVVWSFAFALTGAEIQRSFDGTVNVGEFAFQIMHCDFEWGVTEQSGKSVSFPGAGGDEASSQGLVRRGAFQVRNGLFRLIETCAIPAPGTMNIIYRLESDTPVSTNRLSLFTRMYPAAMASRPLLLNGKPLAFAASFDKNHCFIEQRVTEKDKIVLPTRDGELHLAFNGVLTLEDNRSNRDEIAIHFKFTPSRGASLKESELKLRMTLKPYQVEALDLRPAMNMGLADPVEADGKGGWTDQGPENDLSALTPGIHKTGNLFFEVVDPRKNNGKACIMLSGKERPGFPESAELSLNGKQGRFLYLLNALAWANNPGDVCAYLDILYTDHTSEVIALKRGIDTDGSWFPRDEKNCTVFWTTELKNSVIAGLLATQVPIQNKPIQSIRFRSAGVVWGILAATLAEDDITGKALREVVISEGAEWGKIEQNGPVEKGSIIDFSDLLHKPAGKYGFNQVVGDHFEFEKRPGVPARFWGANILGTVFFMEPDQVNRMLDRFAANGMNYVRIGIDHDLYSETFVKKMSEQERERHFDYFIAACKERGIYFSLDLQASRVINAKLIGGENRRLTSKEYRVLSYFDPRIQDDLILNTRKLLLHPNAYTGIPLKDEPGLIFLNIINESMLPDSAMETPFLKQRMEAFFAQKTGARAGQLSAEERTVEWRKFLREGYYDGYRKILRQVRDMGVKIPITDSNCLWFPRVTDLRRELDFVVNNTYWAHPVYLNLKERWVPPIAISSASAIAACGGGYNPNAMTRQLNQPFAITEWDFVNPNPYNVEGGFLMGSYAALQNYSALARFSFTSWKQLWLAPQRIQNYFDFHHDPLITLSMLAGSCFFLRGDVKEAPESVAYLFPEKNLFGEYYQKQFPEVLQDLALLTRIGIVFSPEKAPGSTKALLAEKDESRTWTHPVIKETAKDTVLRKLVKENVLKKDQFDLEKSFFRSSTGEIELTGSQKSLKIITPKSEGFVLDKGGKLDGDFAEVDNPDTFSAILVASRDENPLRTSRRILLLHLTDAKGLDMKFQNSAMALILDFGKPGLLMRRGKVEIKLNCTGRHTLYACDINGKRLREVPCRKDENGKLSFPANNFIGNQAVCVYELIQEEDKQ